MITQEQFVQWIYDQPDDRPVDMHQPNNFFLKKKDGCGCLMVEYAKDNLNVGDLPVSCSFSKINITNDEQDVFLPKVETMDFNIKRLVNEKHWNAIKTFGDVKKFMTPRE